MVLTVTVSAKQNDTTIFLVEVKQAGLFLMRNLAEADTQARGRALSARRCCSRTRAAAVSQLVTQGGFPQFLLPPVNFDALYAANRRSPRPTTN